jgi:hypothetical protein
MLGEKKTAKFITTTGRNRKGLHLLNSASPLEKVMLTDFGKECCKAGSEKDPKLFAESGTLPSGSEFDPRLHKKYS